MSAGALGGVHLLPAGEAFRRGYPSTRVAVCGELLTSAPGGDEVDPGYCGDCVNTVIQWGQGASAEIEPCPYCGATSEVKVVTGTSPTVQAWSCSACDTEWCVSVINPRSYLDHLAATVELTGARFALRALLTLADDAPALTDADLRSRLTALAGRRSRGPVTTVDDPHAAAVERLIELARERGFVFTPAGEHGSRWGERTTPQWIDVVFLGTGHCNAARAHRGPLSPDEPLFADRVSGPALTVLHTVVYGWADT